MTTFEKEIILENKQQLLDTLVTKGIALRSKYLVETNAKEKADLLYLVHDFIKSIKRTNAEIEALENTGTED